MSWLSGLPNLCFISLLYWHDWFFFFLHLWSIHVFVEVYQSHTYNYKYPPPSIIQEKHCRTSEWCNNNVAKYMEPSQIQRSEWSSSHNQQMESSGETLTITNVLYSFPHSLIHPFTHSLSHSFTPTSWSLTTPPLTQTPNIDRVPCRVLDKHQINHAVRERERKPPIFMSKNFQHNCVGKPVVIL